MKMALILEQIKDEKGRIIYEKHSDGYYERNTYHNDKLVRCETHYSNGQTEVEQFNYNE